MRRLLIFFNVLLPISMLAQEPFERLGQRSMMNGDFSSAANYFEKAYSADNSNMNVLYLMGYSAYHANNYRKSISAFDKLISFKPDESIAYYYRGKAKMNLCQQIKDLNSSDKEPLLLGAIKDFTTGISLTPADMKFYQNRGLAYQEYGIYKSQKINGVYNKNAVISAANSSIADFKKVLNENSGRKDILNQIERSKQIIVDISR
ncbi:tetratricopeptide repeat protein [Pseudopedobacter saltans]|nr:tetratricopeptide repeat protein [Pseudopedobacter saltans]